MSEEAFIHVGCVVCGGSDVDPVAVGQAYPLRDGDPTYLVVRCTQCDLLYLNPRPVADVSSPRRETGPTSLSATAAGLAERDGGEVHHARDLVEPRANASPAPSHARSERLYLVGLEQVDSPREALVNAGRLLQPGGVLILVTPNTGSVTARLFGSRHWSAYDFPASLQLFGRRSIERLARTAGFEVEEVSTLPDAGAWMESVRNFLVDWELRPFPVRRLAGSRIARSAFRLIERRARGRDEATILCVRLRPGVEAGSPAVPAAIKRPEGPFPTGRARAPVAVLGAGVAGLTAAHQLKHRGVPVVVYEAAGHIAGLARSFGDEDGFSHDFGAHFITNRFAAALGIGSHCLTVRRFGEAVRLGDRTYGYPFGLLRSPRFVGAAVREKLQPGGDGPAASVAELYREQFGNELAEKVAIPLVEAWSGVAGGDLSPSVSPPQLDRGIPHVLQLKMASRLSGRAVANGFSRAQPENPHVFHVYPREGVGLITERLAAELEGMIELESPVEAIYVEDGRVRGLRVAGTDHDASTVISTAPVHILPRLVRGTDALAPLSRFRYRPLTLVNMRFDTRPVLPSVCVWVPDRSYTFFRLTEAPLAMPWLAPDGKTIVTVDIGCEVGDRIWTMDQETLGELCLAELEELYPGVRARYLGCNVVRTPVAHPVYLREYEEDRIAFGRGLPVGGLHSIGRNGEFAHILMEDVFWRTRRHVHDLLDRDDGSSESSDV